VAEYSAYRSAELAALYDAVYAAWDDVAFWRASAASAPRGPQLELGCGTGRVLLPLARDGHEVVGLDPAVHMLALCRAKLACEAAEVRGRVTLVETDMASFDTDRRFAQIFCAFGTFHHLRTADEQLACLERCHRHLLPGGRLVLDLINPDPAPAEAQPAPVEEPEADAAVVQWTEGRRIRSWATVVAHQRAQQLDECEVTYEILEPDGSTRRLTETFPMRMVFRFELEHLLARAEFRIAELYGDYDRSAFSDESPGMIVVAEPTQP